jgi:hypothetical protein
MVQYLCTLQNPTITVYSQHTEKQVALYFFRGVPEQPIDLEQADSHIHFENGKASDFINECEYDVLLARITNMTY